MASKSFSIAALFEKAFGYKSEAFEPQIPEQVARKERSATGAPYYAKDVMGREYYMPVRLKYPFIKSDGTIEQREYNLPYPVIVPRGRNNLVKTPLSERSGTFKEMISEDDWEITIRGLMINHDNHSDFPEDDFAKLLEVWRAKIAIRIQSVPTDIILINKDRQGSDTVVIENIDFPPIMGVQHVKPYEIRFLSDTPFNLYEIE